MTPEIQSNWLRKQRRNTTSTSQPHALDIPHYPHQTSQQFVTATHGVLNIHRPLNLSYVGIIYVMATKLRNDKKVVSTRKKLIMQPCITTAAATYDTGSSFHITYQLTGTRYLIDTGTLCTVYSESRHEMNTIDTDTLQLSMDLISFYMAPKSLIYNLPIATTHGHFTSNKSPNLYLARTFWCITTSS